MTRKVKQIIIINAVVWLIVVISVRWLGATVLLEHLALTPERVVDRVAIWQLLTYMWLHSPTDPWHILLNLLFLWMFGGTL